MSFSASSKDDERKRKYSFVGVTNIGENVSMYRNTASFSIDRNVASCKPVLRTHSQRLAKMLRSMTCSAIKKWNRKNQKEQKLTIRTFGENRYPYMLMPSFEPLHSKEEKRSERSFPDIRSPLPAQCTFNVHEHVSFNLRSKWNGEFSFGRQSAVVVPM